jgi:predicted nucleotidyltransferase
MDKDAVIATLRAHRAELERLGVRHAGLFGSMARGEAGPDSDIDIAIDLDEDAIVGVFAYAGVKRQLRSSFRARSTS